jgi:hypothetical protein
VFMQCNHAHRDVRHATHPLLHVCIGRSCTTQPCTLEA